MLGIRHGFKAEAERIALSLRDKIGSSAFDHLDIDALCRVFDIDLIKMTELGCDVSLFCGNDNDKFSAMTVRRGMATGIVHNDTHHEYRQRSNISHELAHCFLGHKGCTILNDNGARNYNSTIEAEASFLGGALLLPKEAALHILINGLKPNAQRLFGISRPMLNYRLRISGAQTIYERKLAKRRAA